MIAAPNDPGPTDMPGAQPITIKANQLCPWRNVMKIATDPQFYAWVSACREEHCQFFETTPIEFGYRFCPYCGKPLTIPPSHRPQP